MSDFYVLLGVSRTATEVEIKKAYRKLAMEFHPDRNSAPEAEARFKEITEAYEVLRDPQKRSAYDRYGKAGLGGGGFGFHHVDLSEALNIFMRDFGGMGGFESIFGGAGVPVGRAPGTGRAGDRSPHPDRGGPGGEEDRQDQEPRALHRVRGQRGQGGHQAHQPAPAVAAAVRCAARPGACSASSSRWRPVPPAAAKALWCGSPARSAGARAGFGASVR